MEIADFNKMQGTNSESLAVKIFSDTCCNGCTCQTTKVHLSEAQLEFELDELELDI